MDQKKIWEKIKKLRQDANMSQDDFAKALDVSRVTFSQIEQGERELKHSELIKIASLFEMSLDNLLTEERESPKIEKKSKDEDPFYKFKQVFLYILNKCAQKPNIGKTALNKLLYFSDFNFYEKNFQSITWVDYIKLPRWPVPKIMDLILPQMEQEQLIKQVEIPYFNYTQQRIIPLIAPDMSIFSAAELIEIDDVIVKYSDKSADWLSERSHNDMPYKATKNIGDTISYTFAHYRDPIYCVTEWVDD